MKRLAVLFLILFSPFLHAMSGKEYMQRFQTYQQWSENLPTVADPDFLQFIDSDTPLANKLRAKWLYQLAHNKDWATFLAHYKESDDISLQCYSLLSLYHEGKVAESFSKAKTLWLNGSSQPIACDHLFEILVTNNALDDSIIFQRIILALENKNVPLARYLLKLCHPPKTEEAKILTDIYLKPVQITTLSPSPLHGAFYLYGLKRLVPLNMKQALQIWEQPKTKHMLNEKQQQSFLAYVSLYKAMRNNPDALEWFSKVKPAYYDSILLDWRIRYALKEQNWKDVEKLVGYSKDKDEPVWQYWLARAKEARGKRDEAKAIYEEIAKTRNYYGFLSSLRLKKHFSFENEHPLENLKRIQAYRPFTDQVRTLYINKQTQQASKLLNEFFLELPKEDKGAMAYWLMNDLQWYGKALNISNSEEELNNQLSLRFPLAYQELITQNAKNNNIPKELIYAIIRQESTFREDVISPAGAHGLMQLMPATASIIAKQENISYSDKKQLFTAPKNISIGSAYLKLLARRFEHPVLISAAYNAGPRQVVYWLKNHPPKQMDIWIETLPWHETRNYIKNIIAFYAVYQYRMNQKPDLSGFLSPIH